MSPSDWRLIAEGFAFVEGIRWHDDALWFSDIFGGEVIRLDEADRPEVVVRVPARPSGLGWAADGALLISSMRDRRLLRYRDDRLETVAELGPLTGGDCNDLLVDPQGRAYVGNFGYDYAAGQARRATNLVLVEPNGRARMVGGDLWFPNGMALTPDGTQLFVAETPAERISVYSVAPDGSLSDRRLLDDLGGLRPDGLGLDPDGRLWVASPGTNSIACVSADGVVLTLESAPGGTAQACVVGGPDGSTLYMCATPTHDEAEALGRRPGQIFARSL